MSALETLVVGSGSDAEVVVVLLHGLSMRASDLAPFAHSIGVRGLFVFPEGPVEVDGGRSFWEVDFDIRTRELELGPRDLSKQEPQGLPRARELLAEVVADARAMAPGKPVVVGGFSQGGMLACDAVMHGSVVIDGLILLSASPIAVAKWPRPITRRMRALVSHGSRDLELAPSAGEALRDALVAAGADVTWIPFEGAHEVPLVVWRQVRKFLAGIVSGSKL